MFYIAFDKNYRIPISRSHKYALSSIISEMKELGSKALTQYIQDSSRTQLRL